MKSVLHDVEKLTTIVSKSISYSQCLREFGLKVSGGNLTTLKYVIFLYNIDYSHFTNRGVNVPVKSRTLEEVLVYGKLESTNRLKHRLIKAGLKKRQCEHCHRTKWRDKDIPLETHHVDGDRLNNRLENIQLLCPNCHTFTPNYRAKNRKPKPKKIKEQKVYVRKTKCPSKIELEKLLWEMPSTHLGKKFNVSSKAIEKWAKKYGLTKPPRGYWSKLKGS